MSDPLIACESTWPDAAPVAFQRQHRHEQREKRWRARSERLGTSCHYCGTELTILTYTVDHVVPKSKGGRDSYDNLVMACKPCNAAKADSSYEDFVAGGLPTQVKTKSAPVARKSPKKLTAREEMTLAWNLDLLLKP